MFTNHHGLLFLHGGEEKWSDTLIGHKIPAIENLGAAGVRFPSTLRRLGARHYPQDPQLTCAIQPQDALDLTDNDITHLGNFPLSPRLTTLLLARNRISTIAPNIADSLPNLANVALLANNISELADLTEGLRKCNGLTHLICLENPVRKKEVSLAIRNAYHSFALTIWADRGIIAQNYRAWVIWRIPSVRFFDYQKVKDVERQAAGKLFGTDDAPTALALKVSRTGS